MGIMLKRRMTSCTGSAVADVVISAMVVIFVILPLFSAIVEKYVLENKAQMIRDSIDMTNLSAYCTLHRGSLAKGTVYLEEDELEEAFKEILAINLKLNESDLTPKPDSLAEGKVEIVSLVIRISDFPFTCPGGVVLTRPGIHSLIKVPVKPTLYRKILLDLMGKEYVDLYVHVDTDLPVNN